MKIHGARYDVHDNVLETSKNDDEDFPTSF